MSKFSSSLAVSCDSRASRPRAIWLEPVGEHFWLFPKDEIQIKADGLESPPRFSISEEDDNTIVYVMGCIDYVVQSKGETIYAGFQHNKFVGAVQFCFGIIGRGIVLTSEVPWPEWLKVGDDLRLIIPDGQHFKTMDATLMGLEIMNGEGAAKNQIGLRLDTTEKVPADTTIYCVYG